jgi:hypothetical protein
VRLKYSLEEDLKKALEFISFCKVIDPDLASQALLTPAAFVARGELSEALEICNKIDTDDGMRLMLRMQLSL